MKKFIINSNIFLFLPVIAAAYVHEWVYFAFALGISIFSPIYHFLSEFHSEKSGLLKFSKTFDWLFALGAYIYMYYFIFTKSSLEIRSQLLLLLSATVLFFWYGFKLGNYKKLHPWFHIFAPMVSSLIVLSK